MMDLLQLRYFCHAAESENFSETARRFSVPPSDISQMMRRLESELNTKLFDRNSNKLTLNQVGKAFYEKINESIRLIDEAVLSVTDSDEKTGGEISLDIRTNRRIVMKAISEFRKKYPEVSELENLDDELENTAIAEYINSFLSGLSPIERRVFVKRYWYLSSVSAITSDTGFSQSKIKSILHRLRKRLRSNLEKEGVSIEI